MTEEIGEKATTNDVGTEPKEAVFTATECAGFKTMAALGGIHINVVLVMLELFLLPPCIALMIIAVQLFFMLTLIDDKSKFERKLEG